MDVAVGDLTFQVLDTGTPGAPVVLLLHGFPQSAHSWRLLVPGLLEAGLRVVAPDQRGYSPGARPADVGSYRLPLLVDDALGLLDALGIHDAHVVGHDWGAAVAWQLAARHPARVRTLTAVSVPHPRSFLEALMSDEDQRSRSLYMLEFAEPGHASTLLPHLPDLFVGSHGVDVDDVLRRAEEPGALDAWLHWYGAQRREDIGDTPAVTVPTTHVWSGGDIALGRAGALGTAQWVTGPYDFVELPGSHWVPEEQPEALLEAVLARLSL